jgi:hypothetical protein
MKSSPVVGLLVVSSFALLGICAIGNSGGNQPTASDFVWVAGQQGVYDPYTHVFCPIGSPGFNTAWAHILLQRQANQSSNGYSGGAHGGGYYWGGYSSGGAHSTVDSIGGGSARGGFGGSGHGFGGGGHS